ncbi:MMPL family transporter [Corynebacterium sp.]|uniref:MMPL family transporter n=1 Tax=Corynebacterium sp. TaxID=1720 RepID=UPI0026DB63E8|nr:MMPL family transporter [Corynebacterium sp.]MDO5033085.1 MMPL family transporter [Corynebacterium sp.]
MAQLLYRVGRWSFKNRWKVIIAWIVIVAASAGAMMALMKSMTTEYSIKGTPAIDATERAMELFPENGNPANAPSVNLVFKAPEGEKLSDPENYAAVQSVVDEISADLNIEPGSQQRWGNPLELSPKLQQGVIDQFTSMGLPEEAAKKDADNLKMVNDDETIAYTTFDFDAESPYSVKQEDKNVVHAAMDNGRAQGIEVEAGGAGFGDEIQVNSTSEIIGLGVAFLVLIFTFGSLVSAGMPLLSAVIGVGLGAMGVMIATHWVELNNITPVLAVMIGLAVGIDYALFIMSRYRQERSRMDGPEAAGMAVGTAGSSVVFAGATVFIALFALIVARIGFLTAMGLSAAGTVLISVLVALTLVPALLGLAGDKAFALPVPGVAGNPRRKDKGKARRRRRRPTMGNRWVRFVQRVPGLTMAIVVLGLGALSAPVLNMELALPADTTSNPDTTQRKSADIMAEGFGEGINGPFLVIINGENADADAEALQPLISNQEGDDEQQKAAFASFMYATQQLNQVGGVKHAQLVGVSQDSKAAQIMVTPTTSPTDPETVGTASALRTQNQSIEEITGAELGMTGLTAVQLDITERLQAAMGPYLAIVVGLAIVLLLAVFRSVMVPVVAGLGFLLSVGGAFGLTVLVWQEGLTGLVPAPGPLISFMPIFLIGVTFGLAMDYQVFLVTRMREHISRHPEGSGGKYSSVEEATIVGFTQGARVVTAAAIIMISVFVAFINQPLPFIQIFGFALAAGVLFDAFLVRMSLVPATMFLMGKATWWMPKWLDKILPELDVEGTALEEEWERNHPEAARNAQERNAALEAEPEKADVK